MIDYLEAAGESVSTDVQVGQCRKYWKPVAHSIQNLFRKKVLYFIDDIFQGWFLNLCRRVRLRLRKSKLSSISS